MQPADAGATPPGLMRFGTVALIGRTNVGKSTFLNAALGEQLAIVSPVAQTTRDPLLGVLTRNEAQIAFLDTPGLHRPRSELGRRMNQSALEVLRATDVVLFMTALPDGGLRKKNKEPIDPEDRAIIARLPKAEDVPTLFVLNKVDLTRDKQRLLPVLAAYGELHPFRAIIPTSFHQENDVELVLRELTALLPEGEAQYAPDTLTDRPESFFVREYIREQVLRATRREVPHAVAVSIDQFETGDRIRIAATIHVEKAGQRKIVVGEGGSMIRDIGTAARHRIEALLGKPVYLELFVRVTERWKNAPRQLAELGYLPGDRSRDEAAEFERISPPEVES